MDIATTIITLLGSLGGVELVKWLFNRRANARIVEAEADGAELRNIQATIDFLQSQVQAKEERFAAQTDRLRQTQDDLFAERERRHQAELQLAVKRCDDLTCPHRQPPTVYTPTKLPASHSPSSSNSQCQPISQSQN